MKIPHPITADLSGDLRARVLELCKCSAIAAQYGEPVFTLADGRSIRLRRDGGATCLTFVARIVELAGGHDPALWALDPHTPDKRLRAAGMRVPKEEAQPGDIVCLSGYKAVPVKTSWGEATGKVPTMRHIGIIAPFTTQEGERFFYQMGGERVEAVGLDDYIRQFPCDEEFYRPG
jgi:hypothetical protein